MATELGQAYVQIMPSAKGISGAIQKIIDPEARAAGQSAGASLGSSLAKAVTGVIAAAGIGKAFSASLMEGANLQQSLGGVETLFGKSADKVKHYADVAYRTAGMSANSYMENVTSFSASLLQSLGGDTEKAAEVANRAMIDMSDNANKMGTDMGRITDAYQGFAKDNYTMLDNLKLGYGGTKTEMQRLIKDAAAMKGVQDELNVSVKDGDLSFGNIVNAISVMQKHLQITGTTLDEAKKTFSGSFASMKAAAQNVLGKLSLGEDIKPSLQTLAETTSVFLFRNFLPMVGNIIKGSFGAVFGDSVANAIDQQFERISAVLSTFWDMAFGSLSKKDNIDVLKSFGFDEGTASQIVNIAENIRVTFENIGATIGNIAGIVGSFIGDLLGLSAGESNVNLLGAAFEGLTGFLRDASEKLKDFTGWLKDNPAAMDAVKSALAALLAGFIAFKVVNTVKNMITGFQTALTVARTAVLTFNAALIANPIGIVVAAIAALVAGLVWFFTQTKTGQQIWAGFVSWFQTALPGLASFLQGVWESIVTVATTVWNNLVAVVQPAVQSVVDFIMSIWSTLTGWWTENQDLILQTASTVWNGISSVIQTVMGIIQTILSVAMAVLLPIMQVGWELIKNTISTVWSIIQTVVQTAMDVILGIIKLVMQLINGDWSGAWETIKGIGESIWNGIVSIATALFNGFANALSIIWDAIKNAASAAWEWIKSTVTNLINGLVQGAQNTWNSFMSFLSGLWETIKSTASSAWETLKSTVLNIINGLVSGAQRAWEDLKRGVSETVSRVTSIFDGLKNIDLFGAGKAIIDGFLNGLKSAYDAVQNFVGGIASWIRQHKGPIEYDRKLLIPAGNAIMVGLDEGLQDKFKDVKSTVSGMAGQLSDAFSGEEFDVTATSPLLNKEVSANVALSSGQMDRMGQDVVSEIAILRSSLDDWLDKLLNKDSGVYLDGEPIAQNVYQRQARMMAREGI